MFSNEGNFNSKLNPLHRPKGNYQPPDPPGNSLSLNPPGNGLPPDPPGNGLPLNPPGNGLPPAPPRGSGGLGSLSLSGSPLL